MKTLLTIGGSTSKTSINKKLAEHVGLYFSEYNVINIDLNDFEMPVFSVDLEASKGFPESAKKLNEIIGNADGFIISLAEHNGAYSAAFKNVFDWLSRIEAKVWRSKPMLLMATSPGARGGASVLEIAKNRFPFHNAQIIGTLAFPSFNDNFKNGEIVHNSLKKNIDTLVKEFKISL
ncbi:MAG TPA: NADPH-dependent FMN reductase [Flavobacteriaceae bacterium]|nr:NADPH-dependent FMN reductase [Flavobacteriaceae bacterium]